MIEKTSVESSRNTLTDAEKFVGRFSDEILPILENEQERLLVERISKTENANLTSDDESLLANILERFETKIFDFTKPDAIPGSKKVLVTANDPAAWSRISQLLELLKADSRCSGVSAVVSGVAGKEIAAKFPEFTKRAEQPQVLADALTLSSAEPIDVVVASTSSRNGPENIALFGAKSSLGAAKTFLVLDGVGTFAGGAFNLGSSGEMENIDGILVPDALTKADVLESLPEYPENHIYDGSSLGTESLELSKADAYRTEIRQALSIPQDAFVVTYAGDISADYAHIPGADPDINLKTFHQTFDAVERAASDLGERPAALIIRPHPRDPQKAELLSAGNGVDLPDNLSLKNDTAKYSFNAIAYASDAVVSIISTENILAPIRGIRGVFLAYGEPGEGLGRDILEQYYRPNLIRALEQMEGVAIAHSPQELEQILVRFSKTPARQSQGETKVSGAILDTILG